MESAKQKRQTRVKERRVLEYLMYDNQKWQMAVRDLFENYVYVKKDWRMTET